LELERLVLMLMCLISLMGILYSLFYPAWDTPVCAYNSSSLPVSEVWTPFVTALCHFRLVEFLALCR
jgi:hypothetical protein